MWRKRNLPTPRRGDVARWLLICLMALALVAACEPDEEGGELGGSFGPGSGGPPVDPTTVVTDPIVAPSGQQIGTLAFDSGYLTRTFTGTAADDIIYSYGNLADLLAIDIARITGRADTPCRFSAAFLARDEGFQILASGDVFNDQGLEFHQVNLRNGNIFQRFYCVELQPNVGIEISATTLAGDLLDYEQIHFLLNSITP